MLYQTKNPHGGDVYGEEIRLDYSANTNPFGTPEAVLEAVRQALPELHRYPDPYCRRLVAAISQFEGVPAEWILCGNGSAELIYAYCRALKPKKAAELAPTFSEYSLGLEQVGCPVVRYPLRAEQDFRVDEGLCAFLRAEQPEVLFLCNPNNPTGQLIHPELLGEILHTCRELGTRLFLDECFLGLTSAGVSRKESLGDYPELLILKAYTKSYGMAGLRLGYCLCADEGLLRALSQGVQPWNVSIPAQAAGIAALGETEFLRRTVALVDEQRRVLHDALTDCGFAVCPSSANYLLFRAWVGLDRALRSEGIAIRSCANYEGLGPGWYRIAVRLPEENRALIAAIRALRGKEDIWQKTL